MGSVEYNTIDGESEMIEMTRHNSKANMIAPAIEY